MTDNRRYTPLLRWKEGEQIALAELNENTKENMTPLIMLSADNYKPRKSTAKVEAASAAVAFCDEIAAAWGEGEFMLYAPELLVADSAQHPIALIGAAALEAGLMLTPVVRLDDPDDYKTAALAVASDGHGGVALRVDLQEMTSAEDWADSFAPANTDLIIDFADSVEFASGLGDVLGDAFAKLHAGADWRSVVVAGSSIPDDFSGFPAGVHRIPRREFALWKALRARGLPYELFFGDYATISPNARPPGVRWGFPINAKYTLADDFLVCRGIRTVGGKAKPGAPKVPTMDMGPQLIGHANSISRAADRGAIGSCWGDQQIDAIAAGSVSPGGLAQWVQYSVNRHIERTVRQVA